MIKMHLKRPADPRNAHAWAAIGQFIAAQRTQEQTRAARWFYGKLDQGVSPSRVTGKAA